MLFKRENKKRFFLCVFAIILGIGVGIFAYVYQNTIIGVQNVSLRVKQFDKVNLPQEVSAKFRNNSTKNVKIRWNSDFVDTKDLKSVKIKGTVGHGYTKEIILSVTVVSVVPSVLVEEGERAEIDLTPNLKFISKEEAIHRLLVENEFTNKPEVLRTMNAIKKLPTLVLNKLISDGITIKYVPDKIEPTKLLAQYGKAAAGKTSFATSSILVHYVEDQPKKETIFSKNCVNVTLHEIGHAFDYKKKTEKSGEHALSDTPVFKKIHVKEGAVLFNKEVTGHSDSSNKYYTENGHEYFAECFELYFSSEESKKKLQEKAPETYGYIDEIISAKK